MSNPTIIDISPVVSTSLAVWPGDTPFSQKFAMRIDEGAHLELSSIQSTVHLGAHCDAPSHYIAGGQGIDQRDLSYYHGKCQIISVSIPRGKRIYPKDIPVKLEAPRVLFKTLSYPDPNHFNTDFNSLSPEVVQYAHEQNVVLIGLDTPSVDPFSSKKLESHKMIADYDMAILEGVVLAHVPDGIYTLIAFPLRIAGADASPVRAVLLQ